MKNIFRKLCLFTAIALAGLSVVSVFAVMSPMTTQTVYAQTPAEEPPSCEDDNSDWTWAICPTLRMIDNFIKFIDREIDAYLSVPSTYFTGDSGEAVRGAWGRMRNIAYVIMVPVMLVMVISTALGFEFISAYTIKRALPRLVIAVIFIAVSYDLCIFLVQISNELGRGLQGLITSSITAEVEIDFQSLFSPDGVTESLLYLSVTAGGVVAAGALPMIFAYAVVAAISLFIAFLMLTLRRAFVVMAIILAPLAIISWIFPGNDKLWKLWWGSFWKLLAVYPLVSVLIATGRVFASIIAAGPNPGFVQTGLAGFVLVFSYAIGPLAVQRLSGAFGVLTGNAAGALKGANTWMKGKGRKAAAERMRQTAAGTNKLSRRSIIPVRLPAWRMFGRFGGKRIGEGAMGNIYRRGALAGQGNFSGISPLGLVGATPLLNRVPIIGTAGRRSRAKYAAGRRRLTDEGSKKAFEAGNDEIGGDDNLTNILSTDGMTQGRATQEYQAGLEARGVGRRRARRKAEMEVARAVNYYGAEVGSTTMQTAAYRSWATSKTNDDIGNINIPAGSTPDQIAGLRNAAVANMERRIQEKNASMTGRGLLTSAQVVNLRKQNKARPDQAAESWGAQWAQQEAQELRWQHGDRGAAIITDNEITGRLRASINRTKPGELISADYRGVDALVNQITGELQEAQAGAGAYAAVPVAQRQVVVNRMYGSIAGAYDNMAYADPHVQTILAEHVMSQHAPGGGVGLHGGPARIWDRVEQLRPDTQSNQGRIYHSTRRELLQGVNPGGAGMPGGPLIPPSDRRLKRHISALGQYVDAEQTIQLYRFKYVWSNQEYVGVMAQEVLLTRPDAVILDESGYYRVAYARLGTRMYTIEAWRRLQVTSGKKRSSIVADR